MSTGLWNGTAGLGRRPSLTLGNQSLWSGASGLVSPGAWLPPAYAGATLALDLDGSMSGIPGAAYLNGTYYNAFADVPGASVTGGAGFATAINAAGQVVGPFAANTLPATSGGGEIWEARTNLVFPSASFAGSNWNKNNTVALDNQIPAPNGTIAAGLITEGTTGGQYLAAETVNVTGTVYTASVYLRRISGADWYRVAWWARAAPANSIRVWVNLSTGAVGTSSASGSGFTLLSASMVNLSGGWYRIILTGSSTTETVTALSVLSSPADNSTSRVNGSVYGIWGAQLEAGSFPTPYIPTTTAAATRTAIAPSITGLGSILTPPFTVYAEAYFATAGFNNRFVVLSDGTTANRVIQARNDLGRATAIGVKASVGQGTQELSGLGGVRSVKSAVRVRANGYRLAAGGSISASEMPATMDQVLNRLDVGHELGSSLWLNGQVRRICILPDMSDAQLQALTA